MGKSSKKPKQRVTEYFMTIHFGICHGPVEYFSRIKINGKQAWTGRVSTQARYLLSRTGLFGGNKKEGGIEGDIYYQPGSSDQLVDSFVASKYGRTPTTMTGYRGIATVMFTDRPGISRRSGFYWSANQPYIPPVEFRVTRIFYGWNPLHAKITRDSYGPRAIYISIDNSGSMAGDKLDTMKTAMHAVLDDIEIAIQAGLDLDIGIQRWAGTETDIIFNNATVANVSALRTFIDDFDALGSGTNFDLAAQGAVSFFNARLGNDYDRRMWVFMTDGVSFPAGTSETAASTAADLLNPSSGDFNVADRTEVACHGLNIELDDVSETLLLDNTPSDGVPIIEPNDPSSLQGVIRSALFGSNLDDMNPAHIIYECITNRVWGMGAPSSVINAESFLEAAETLYNENFGLSLAWLQQTEIESIIQEILDHIEATLYLSPSSGQFVLKLIRDDYDVGTLPTLDETNCEITSYTRRLPGEITNEINLTWTNPRTDKEEVLTIQDLAGIVTQGGEIISDNRNYYACRDKDLAWDLCQRDMATATADLATVELEADRTAWDFVPGGVFKLTSEEHNAVEQVMRIVKIKYGKPGDSKVRINATEDVFAYERPVYEIPPDTVAEDEDQEPTDITDVVPMSLNYFLAVEFVSTTGTQEYPDSYVAFLAATDNTDGQDYELIGEEVDATGSAYLANLGTRSFVSKAELAEAWDFEATTITNGFDNFTAQGETPLQGTFALIGDAGLDEDQYELCLVMDFTDPQYTLRRGILDTVPREWPAGTSIRFFTADTAIIDEEARAFGDSLDYDFLMNTSLGQGGLGPGEITYDPIDRIWLPTRPANVEVEGTTEGTVDTDGLSVVECTWANRNRVTEDAQPLSFTAANVTPEDGQTTVIEFYDETDIGAGPYNSISVTEGDTSYDIPIGEFSGSGLTILKFRSSREGLLSFTGIERRIDHGSGYGNLYGLDYGGSGV